MAIFNTIYQVEDVSSKWWSPMMTSNDAPIPYAVQADAEYTGVGGGIHYYAYYAFDGDLDAPPWYSANGSDRWLIFDAGTSIKVKGVGMFPSVHGGFSPMFFPKNITISGSDDGESWIVISADDGAGYVPIANARRIIMFDKAVTYRYFKFSFGPAYNGYEQTIVSEIQFAT